MPETQPSSAAKSRRRQPQRAKQLGVSDQDYELLLFEQGGVCAICGKPPKTRRLHVDHNHRTLRVRGLLCFRCNRQLSNYVTGDWLRKALVYVDEDEHFGAGDQWEALRA